MNKEISQFEYAYIAGYVDGDGCFYIGKERSEKRLKQKNVISIIIASVNQNILLSFQELHGGSIIMSQKEHDNSKTQYQLVFKKKEAIKLAEQIHYLLVEKQQECGLVLRFKNRTSATGEQDIEEIRLLKHQKNLVYKFHKSLLDKEKKIRTPIPEDFAYLAGFIDAECSFGIQKYKPKDKPNYVYKIMLQCNNTKFPVFQWLVHRFGGQIYFVDRSKYGVRDQLAWRITGKALANIIDDIYPFLKHKKPVCKQLIDFYAITLPNGGARHTETFRSQYAAIIEEKERIIAEVHKLNLKGIKNI